MNQASGKAPDASARGLTLIELVIYLGIVGIVLSLAVGLALTFVETEVRGGARATVDAAAHRALTGVTEAVHAATAINTNDSTFGSVLGRLSLTMRDAARSPTVFAVSGSALTFSEQGSAAAPLTPAQVEVTRFQLTHVNPAGALPGVAVELGLRFRNPAGHPAYQFSKTYAIGAILR